MINQPFISVVTVSYNAVATIEETILSVLNQTYRNVEYIIIDGGSTDGTVDVIKKYADRLAYWVSEPDKGIYDAMNKGIAIATGDYINFMNAGDRFYNRNVLSEFIPKINSDSVVIYGDVLLAFKKSACVSIPLSASQLAERMVFCHQSAFTKTAFHKQHPFITTFRSAGDYKFFYDAFFVYHTKFQYVHTIVSVFDNTIGMSKDNYFVSYKEQLIIRNEQDSLYKRCRIVYNHFKLYINNLLPARIRKLIRKNTIYINK